MKMPWDRDYFKIAIHVIFTAVVIRLLFILMDTLMDIGAVLRGLAAGISWFLNLLAPLVIGLALAYIVEPAVAFFHRMYGKFCEKRYFTFFKRHNLNKKAAYEKRTAGAAIAYLMIFGLFLLILALSIYRFSRNNTDGKYLDNVADNIRNAAAGAAEKIDQWKLSGIVYSAVNKLILGIEAYAGYLADTILEKAASLGVFAVNVFIGIVLAFYISERKAYICYKANELCRIFIKERYRIPLMGFLQEIHGIFSGFIRGQLLDAFILAVIMSVALSAVQIDFAVPIGIITGIANIIPYFGAVVGFVLAVGSALMGGSVVKAIYTAAIVLVIQQIDGMVIGPKVVGEKVRLSPPLVILALSVGGKLLGIWGMVFAVPLCASFKAILVKIVNRYKSRSVR